MFILLFIFNMFAVSHFIFMLLVDIFTPDLKKMGYKYEYGNGFMLYHKNRFKKNYKEIFIDFVEKEISFVGSFNYKEMKAILKMFRNRGVIK